MNLSYPANFYATSLQSGVIGTYTLGAPFGSGMSYGCAIPETIGTTTYPNTSCVNETGAPITADACVAAGGKCAGFALEALEPIYWQKNSSNKWQAGYALSPSAPLPVNYVDWGDNLEGKSWPVQVLRVETNTFSPINAATRFDMWHVFGQGTNELWGAHATNPTTVEPVTPSLPYVYSGFPYAVNVTSKARLNIAKLESGFTGCPAVATGSPQSPYAPMWLLNTNGTGGWQNVPYSVDMVYGAELNIKGSYVYGYNWNLRSEPVPGTVSKSGWWRLTFYTPDNSIDFSAWTEPTPLVNTLAPPLSTLVPAPITFSAVTAAESETGLLLYVPAIDKTNNLTFLDICIKATTGGGGKQQ